MLKVQEYLQKHSLEDLKNHYGIDVTYPPTYVGEPLVILNYHQIDSEKHKYSPIVKECRGLVLDYHNNFECVAKTFPRFFNYGEHREDINKFDWNNFSVDSKEDGSLAIVYNYKGSWRMNTRGSFSNGKPSEDCQFTWEELFFNCIKESGLEFIDEDITLIFELCSPWNKVVHWYPEPKVFLLTAINRIDGEECDLQERHHLSQMLLCETPLSYSFDSIEEILSYIDKCQDSTFEGFVIRDKNNLRMKIKNPDYLRLHRMRGNGGTLFSPKNLVPFILEGETGELLATCLRVYPETQPFVEKYTEILDRELKSIEEVWNQIKNRNTQKSFALKVMELLPKWSSILFNCRKLNKEPIELWRQSAESIVKLLDKELSSATMNLVKTSQPEGE